MSSCWHEPIGPFNRIIEVSENKSSVEPVGLYNERYSRDVSLLSVPEKDDPYRYLKEVLLEFDKDSSLLVFGAGHSYNMNTFSKVGDFSKITAWDFATSAKTGLNCDIQFFDSNILSWIPTEKMVHDYVFTSHTLEHFTRKELLTVVVPKLLLLAKKAVVIIVPHADNWAEEKTHKCRFYLNDELASMSDKVKLIRGGVEAVYWVGVK